MILRSWRVKAILLNIKTTWPPLSRAFFVETSFLLLKVTPRVPFSKPNLTGMAFPWRGNHSPAVPLNLAFFVLMVPRALPPETRDKLLKKLVSQPLFFLCSMRTRTCDCRVSRLGIRMANETSTFPPSRKRDLHLPRPMPAAARPGRSCSLPPWLLSWMNLRFEPLILGCLESQTSPLKPATICPALLNSNFTVPSLNFASTPNRALEFKAVSSSIYSSSCQDLSSASRGA